MPNSLEMFRANSSVSLMNTNASSAGIWAVLSDYLHQTSSFKNIPTGFKDFFLLSCLSLSPFTQPPATHFFLAASLLSKKQAEEEVRGLQTSGNSETKRGEKLEKAGGRVSLECPQWVFFVCDIRSGI